MFEFHDCENCLACENESVIAAVALPPRCNSYPWPARLAAREMNAISSVSMQEFRSSTILNIDWEADI